MASDVIVASVFFAVLVMSLAVNIITLWKVRKVHLAMFSLKSLVISQSDGLFANLQALFALERRLGLSEPLPQTRGWAGSPDFLLILADQVRARRPKTVVECSSGVSTIVVARSLQLLGSGHVYSLEHDEGFAAMTQGLLNRQGLGDWATIIHAPLERSKNSAGWYSLANFPSNCPSIDMLIVDGPPCSVDPLARLPALPRLMAMCSERVTVLIDDANRPGEIEMLSRWKQQYPELEQVHLGCEKGCVMLRRG